MRNRLIHLTILILLGFCVSANAAYWESSVTAAGTISPTAGSDYGRILFKFDLPGQFNDVIIDYAELIFTSTPDTGSSYISLLGAFPVARNWESGIVSWSSGWINPGGDYIDSIYTCCRIRISPDEATSMDITDIVQMWADGAISNYGLILIPLEDSNRFLKLQTTASFTSGVKAIVRIFYTREDREN